MSDAGIEGEFENLRADIARMSERLAQLEGRDPTGETGVTALTALRSHPAAPFAGPELTVSDTAETVVAQPVSRRGALLALGGVAASGVGLAVGSTLIGAAPAAAAPPPGKSVFLLPTPIRVLDTREPGSPAIPDRPPDPVPANSGVVATIGGVTVNGITIPLTATGIIGNATVAAPSADGFLTLYAAAQIAVPAVSNLNFQSGDVARANFCVVLLNGAGEIIIYTTATTDVVFDVTGYVM
jgi:hypothetical protein